MRLAATSQEQQSETPTTDCLLVDYPEAFPFDAIDAITQSLLICGNADMALELLPGESIQTVVTFPPYWSLRDYNVDEQIGRVDLTKGRKRGRC